MLEGINFFFLATTAESWFKVWLKSYNIDVGDSAEAEKTRYYSSKPEKGDDISALGKEPLHVMFI